jgi:hypothetical protein
MSARGPRARSAPCVWERIGGVTAPAERGRQSALEIAAAVLGLAGYVYALGGLVVWVRLTAAHLPADLTTTLLDPRLLLAIGLRTLLFAALVLGVICGAAYVAGNAPAKVRRMLRGDTAGAGGGDGYTRTIVGLNVLALSVAFGIGATAALRSTLPDSALIAVFLVVWLVAAGGLAWLGSRILTARTNWIVGIALVLIALAWEFPVGVMIVALVVVAILAPSIIRKQEPRDLLRSRFPWALGAIYAVVAFAFVATPPVTYPRAVVQTDQGVRIGAYLARSDDGVYLATCEADTRGRSRGERLVLVRQDAIQSITLGGTPYRFDSGSRPSLLEVMLRPFGVVVDLPKFRLNLRPAAPVCDSEERSTGGSDQGLGPGVIVDPIPDRQRPQEEPTIAQTSPAALAELALRYQPTVLTTVADRFWPVTVSSVLAARSADGTPTCLVREGRCAVRQPTLSDLTPDGDATESLDFPAPLINDPMSQFLAYARGQGIDDDDAGTWYDKPEKLDPWATSAVYFYYAGKVEPNPRYGTQVEGLLGLQYWFFYPYNYYPTVIERRLMLSSPLGALERNTDLHEGDWEHVTVFLDPATMQPRFLYQARHDTEGQLLRWTNSAMRFDGEHPIVQAALGGHPSYDPACRERPRALLGNQTSDWVVCATGRYAFRADTTPLIDLARASWACWPGRFGEAKPEQRRVALLSELQRWHAKVIKVAGPRSPLRQAENVGVCERGPMAAEEAAPVG